MCLPDEQSLDQFGRRRSDRGRPGQELSLIHILLERSSVVFGDKAENEAGPDVQPMQAKIGQLTLENDFLERALTKAGC